MHRGGRRGAGRELHDDWGEREEAEAFVAGDGVKFWRSPFTAMTEQGATHVPGGSEPCSAANAAAIFSYVAHLKLRPFRVGGRTLLASALLQKRIFRAQ